MSQSSTTGRVSEPTPAQMKEFFAQVESGRITKERLQDFLRGQAPALPSYFATLDYDLTVEQLVRSGQYDWANDTINSRNFPSREKGQARLDIFLLNFDRNISSENALKEMDKLGLRPATLKELLALGAQHLNLQRKDWIVALGSSWRYPSGDVCVPFLNGDVGSRHLSLFWFGGDWSPFWRFAAVRK